MQDTSQLSSSRSRGRSYEYNAGEIQNNENMIQGYIISQQRLGEDHSKAMREVIRDHQHQRSQWVEMNSGRLDFMPTM